MKKKIEVWKEIEGCESKYEVSDTGSVRSMPRNKSGLGRPYPLIMKQSSDKDGYMTVSLRIGGKSCRHRVHRLVASAFIKNEGEKPLVNHKSGVKDDNRVENLEWVTASENSFHAVETGLVISNFEKYKDRLVNDYNSGISIRELCRRYKISSEYVSKHLRENGIDIKPQVVKYKEFRTRLVELIESGYKNREIEKELDYQVPYDFIRGARSQHKKGLFKV